MSTRSRTLFAVLAATALFACTQEPAKPAGTPEAWDTIDPAFKGCEGG